MSNLYAKPTVAAIVVTHLGPGAMLQHCLESLVDAGGIDVLVVVDNSPGTASERSTAGIGAGVDCHLVVDNHGFGAAVNAGVAAVGRVVALERGKPADYFAVFNDDVTVRPGWLQPLLDEAGADAGIGGVQPKLLVAGSDPAVINSLGVSLDAAGAGTDIGMGELDRAADVQATDIQLFTGGAVLLCASFVDDLGGFDERYFLYYEDVDLALRGAERGWRFRCVPASVVHHLGSATTQHLGHEVRRLQERNRLWVAFRFGSRAAIGQALWLSIRRLRHEPHGVHARALGAGLLGAPRRLVERRGAVNAASKRDPTS